MAKGKQCVKCLMGTDIASVVLDSKGVCQYCNMHKRLDKQEPISEEREQQMANLIRKSRKGPYDCIVGVSGGSDSSFMLHWAKSNGLNPLAVHFNNTWNTKEAQSNIYTMVHALNVNLFEEMAPDDYHEMNKAFLLASTSEADLPNDIMLLMTSMKAAKLHKVKYILSGHNFRTEGTAPLAWTLMDSNYLYDIFKTFADRELDIPLMTWWNQMKYRLAGITTLRPLYHIGSTKEDNKKLLAEEYGWRDYGSIHMENIYTAFVGAYLLPRKFGIDKRRIYLSAKIRSGGISKSDAKIEIAKPIEFPKEYLSLIEKRYIEEDPAGILADMTIDEIMKLPPKTALDYGNYLDKYIKYAWAYRAGIRVGMFPKTFEKYVNEAPRLKARFSK